MSPTHEQSDELPTATCFGNCNVTTPFIHRQKVLFRHCDPAGIVFYPRYFEMVNDCVEAFFAEVLTYPFEMLSQEHAGVPTVQIDATFTAPSRHGDLVELALTPTAIGKRSFSFDLMITSGGERRMSAQITLVHVKNDESAPWPPEVRMRLSKFKGDNL